MRAFIAIDLSPENKKQLALLQDELRSSNADVKWVEIENIHLTLKFLREISEEQAGQIKEILDRISMKFKPFEVTLSGIGAFPTLEHPRIIWAGIDKGRIEAKQIAQALEDELLRLGFPKEEREFSPHLTIGRVRGAKNTPALKRIISDIQNLRFAGPATMISSINLYRSTLTPQGPIYTALHKALLS